MSCARCEAAVSEAVGSVPGVSQVSVDIERKPVAVGGQDFDDSAVRRALNDAGYQVAE